MPIYEYVCSQCSVPFELMFIGACHPEMVCPKCGSKKIEKVMSAPHVRMGRDALATVPDPEPPLQRQKRMGPMVGYTGGYEDVPQLEEKNMFMNKDREGNYIWKEKERTTVCDSSEDIKNNPKPE